LQNATQLVQEFDIQVKKQYKDKKNKLTYIRKNRQSIIVLKYN